MKTQSETLLKEISKAEMENLTSQVKETIARDTQHSTTLSAAQLYNIQRRSRILTYRRSIIW